MFHLMTKSKRASAYERDKAQWRRAALGSFTLVTGNPLLEALIHSQNLPTSCDKSIQTSNHPNHLLNHLLTLLPQQSNFKMSFGADKSCSHCVTLFSGLNNFPKKNSLQGTELIFNIFPFHKIPN